MADYTIKQNDTYPPLEAVLSDATGPIDLTTSTTITMILKATTGAVVPYLTKLCSIVNAPGGRVRASWAPTDLDMAGTYNGEFEIIWDDSSVETVPNSGYFSLEIEPDLGP